MRMDRNTFDMATWLLKTYVKTKSKQRVVPGSQWS